MYGTIIYIALGLVTAAKVFEHLIRQEIQDWGNVDATDVAMTALISILLGAMFPLVVIGVTIYNLVLQPIVIRVNKEKENVRSMR